MKKLIALLFCLTVMATAAQAQQKQKQLDKNLANKVINAPKIVNVKNMRVNVTLTAQTPYDNSRNLKHVYECGGFIINKNGDVAIHKGCAEAIDLAQKQGAGHVAINIDMGNLGKYRETAEPFYYESASAEASLFVDHSNYLLFAIPFSPQSQAKAALEKAFDNQQGFTKEKVAALVKTLPAIKKRQEL